MPNRSVPVFLGGQDTVRSMLNPVTHPVPVDTVLIGTIRETRSARREPFGTPRSVGEVARAMARFCRATVARCAPPLEPELPFLDFRTCAHNNMAHFFVEVLPCYLLARRHLPGDLVCVMRKVVEPYSTLLRHFGMRYISTVRRVAGTRVRMAASRGLWCTDFQEHAEIMHLTHVPEIYDQIELPPLLDQPKKVFLARRDHRALRNQAEVESLLVGLGYRTVFMEDLDPISQMALAANIEDVVAIHGAAMGLLTLNRRLKSVVEILPPHVYHNYFPLLLGPKAESYAIAMADFDELVTLGGWADLRAFKDRPFSIPLDVLEQAVRSFVT